MTWEQILMSTDIKPDKRSLQAYFSPPIPRLSSNMFFVIAMEPLNLVQPHKPNKKASKPPVVGPNNSMA